MHCPAGKQLVGHHLKSKSSEQIESNAFARAAILGAILLTIQDH
jgi:hypothetical protein